MRRPDVAEPSALTVLLAVEQLRRRVPGGIGAYARGLLGGLAVAAAEGDGAEEIGRASCRERVFVGV